MRVLILVLTVLSSALATQFLTADDLEQLFGKYARNELSEAENRQFQDVLEIFRTSELKPKSVVKLSLARTSIDCLVCRSAFATVFEGVRNGQTDKEITDIVVNLCFLLGIESQPICDGAVSLNVPIITHIIRTTPEATPRTFCGHVFQSGDNPNFCRVDDPRFEWQVDLPPPAPPSNLPPIDTRPLKIAFVTDAHIDPLYEPNGVAECGAPTCCRKGQTLPQTYKQKSNIDEAVVEKSIVNVNGVVMLDLSAASNIRKMRNSSPISYASMKTPEPAGYWGDYRNCDTPLWAYDDVIDRIAEAHKDIDVVYYVGDTIDHFVWETTYELINDMNRHLIEKMRSSFGENVLVIPTIGNHESQPTNQFAPSSVTGEYLNTTWLYDGLAKKWDYYLTEEAKVTLKDRGDFSILVRPGLRVITINNNVAYTSNWWLAYDPLDAKKHLDWLISELLKAEQAGEKVHIVTHIPPGVGDLTHTWSREYNRIVNRFTATIAAEFNGHTHADQFKIFFNPEGRPINVAWGGGSATTYSFYNLNYKIVDINPATFVPQSIQTYVYNLTEANLTPNRRPHWFQLYDIKNTYRLDDLSPDSMYDLVRKMVTTNRELLDIYSAFHYKLSDSRWPYCNINCKLNQMCNTVTTVLWERQRCDELRSLYTQNLNVDHQ